MNENLELLIKLGVILVTNLILVVDYMICCKVFQLFMGIKTLIIFLKTSRKNQLHVEGNKFYQRYRKICLLGGKPNPSWEEYESHFVGDAFYYE